MALFAQPTFGETAPAARDWSAERGAEQWEGSVDLVGGFPGFAARGGRLDGAKMCLTDRYLTVDEGRPHGFGLPIRWLASASTIVSSDRGDVTLRLGYQDGGAARTFAVRFRGSLGPFRGSRRAEQALAAFREVGVAPDETARSPKLPLHALGWDAFEQENVIWNGAVSAMVGGGFHLERVACHVWLTTRFLLWGNPSGATINRLSLAEVRSIVSTQMDDRSGTPVIFVAVVDEAGDRHEIPFVFNRQSPAERNGRERGAFLVGLRSRGLPLVAGAPLLQPWKSALPIEQQPASASLTSFEVIAEPVNRVTEQHGRPPAGMESGLANTRATSPDHDAVRQNGRELRATLPERIASSPDVLVARNGNGRESPAADPLMRVRAYEAAALAMITEALRVTSDANAGRRSAGSIGSGPSLADQATALGDLVDLMAEGKIAGAEARLRKERLMALGGAGTCLRSLVESRDAGQLSTDDFARQRKAIMAPLARVLVDSGHG